MKRSFMVWFFGLFLLVGCGAPAAPETPTEQERGRGMETAVSSSTSPPPTTTAITLSDDVVATQLDVLTGNDADAAQDAVAQIVAANDRRFIAVFIELIRFRQLGLARALGPEEIATALESLSGQEHGWDWAAWVEWYGGAELQPPPGFTGWKGQVLSRIDPGFGEFLQDDYPSNIRVEEIQWGGVRVDAIPALDNPRMLTADKATYLNPDDAVFGLYINDDARAYPLRILDWHEMANDVVGGVPVSLAYCTLCGAAVAFDGRANGETYTFGSSGFLFRSNKLMYDRQTRTLWNQLTGAPVLGSLADEDIQLDILPVVLTTWREWQNRHPDTKVVDVNTGFPRDYTAGAAYGDYFAADTTMFPVWRRSDVLDTKDQIYALRINGVPKAYPVETLAAEQVVNDEIDGEPLVLVAPRPPVEIDGDSRRAGPVTYSAGAEVRAYSRGDHVFRSGPEDDVVLDDDNREWQVAETALIGPDGIELPRLPGHLAYWFGWYAFFPNTQVYGQ